MKKQIKSPILFMMAAIIGSSCNRGSYVDHSEYQKRKENNLKRIAEINKKQFGERPLSKFNIKGHEIEARSRKDAIIKLKHRGLL